jgi:two-component system chemotaxis response regulator CheB
MSTRIVIVDDSIFMRTILKSALSSADGMDVVATAQNGIEGLKKILEFKPDVVTLDIEMPGLDGLQVLERIMKEHPLPVVMVSTKTQRGARATLDALSLGAIAGPARINRLNRQDR